MKTRHLMFIRATSVMLLGALSLLASACEDPDDILPTPPGDATVAASDAGDAKAGDAKVEAAIDGSTDAPLSTSGDGSVDSGVADAEIDGGSADQ